MFGVQSLSVDDNSHEDCRNSLGLIDFHDLPKILDDDQCISNSLIASELTDMSPCIVKSCSRSSVHATANKVYGDRNSAAFTNCLDSEESEKTGAVGAGGVEQGQLFPLPSDHWNCCETTEDSSLQILKDFDQVSSYSAGVSSIRDERDGVSQLEKVKGNSPECKRIVCGERVSMADLENQHFPSNSDLPEPFLEFRTSNEMVSCLNSLQTPLNVNCEDRKSGDLDHLLKVSSEDLSSLIDERSVEEPEEKTVSSSSEAQRIRRKRLYSFSSDSSSDDDFDLSSSTGSRTSSSRSGSSDAGKNCKLEETPCQPAKDSWRQTSEIFGRQLGSSSSRTSNISFQQRVCGSLSLVQRLELYAKFERHQGCVNALNFNETGTLIASGSDDLQIIIWDWVREKPVLEFDSGHRANVFQAKFMPYSGDSHIVSCARDGQVRLAQLSVTGACKGTKKLAQHKGSAHKLSVLPDSCHSFLSCGEDGVTYQIDLRQEKPVRLCTTEENGRYVALYSVHVNPFNCHEYCVGGRDPYIRIYDSRKTEVVKKFCPQKLMDRSVRSHVTCVVYNYNGTAILGTYNDDDIYLFDSSHSDGAGHTHRYTGHRNSATVKGVNFFGPKSEYVVSGSDCGNIFLWDVESEAVVNYFHGDENGIVNVLEPHPHIPILATGGLDNDVKLWYPTAEQATDLQGLHKMMSKNRRDRRKEESEPELIDSEMLWFLMHRLRRSATQFQEDASNSSDGDLSSLSSSSSSSEEEEEEEEEGGASADDADAVRCSQS